MGSVVGDGAEFLSKKLQFVLMSQEKKELGEHIDSGVILNDTMLKFHIDDKRKEFQNKHTALVTSLLETL